MDYREMARLASNPPAVRLCAKTIKAVIGEELTDWERSLSISTREVRRS